MQSRDLWDLEDAFAGRYVSGPHSGELVKGHRIVIAELGLVPYVGKMVRDPGLFDDRWRREGRAGHILARLAFVSALFRRLGHSEPTLYRGMSINGSLHAFRNDTFVSATFSREVAESHFDCGGPGATGILYRQSVPVERVFMTYLETIHMNRQFREAEAVLLYEGATRTF
jgi:hypothetical protein